CTAWGGQAQIASLLDALEASDRGEVDAVVFGPFNKHALALAGVSGDETVILKQHFRVSEVRTVTRWNKLLRSTVVGHVPFTQIRDRISEAAIGAAIDRLIGMCERFGIPNPRIGVAGLNPHAGD